MERVERRTGRCRMCGSAQVQALGRAEGYAFVECRTCGFIFIPSLERSELEAAYQNGASSIENGAPSKGWAPGLQFLAPAFEQLGRTALHRMLDFGCGHSRIPALLRARGHRVIAVDLEPPVQPHPDRHTGDILEMNLASDQFDLVYAYQVFEHLPEPRPILEELLRLTRPGGLVLIHTDMETPQRQEAGFFDWFYVMPPDHCSYYRRRTFEHVLEGRAADLVWSDPWRILIEARTAWQDVH